MRFLPVTVSAYIFIFDFFLIFLQVNTDQTSHMDHQIRDFQSKSLPLGRFAEVDVFFNLYI